MKARKALAVTALAAIVGLFATAADAAVVLKAGHDSPETVPVAKGLAKWAELVEQRTNGEVKIQVYNNGTAGSASDYAVNCQLGTLDIGAVNQSVMTPLSPISAPLISPISSPPTRKPISSLPTTVL